MNIIGEGFLGRTGIELNLLTKPVSNHGNHWILGQALARTPVPNEAFVL